LHRLSSSFRASLSNSRRDLLDGAAARLLAVLLLYPLDGLKSRLQMTSASSRRAIAAAAARPLSRAYAGVGAAALGQLPYGALTFGAFEVFRGELAARYPDVHPANRSLLSAVLADLVGSLWLAPAEHLKLKVQTGVYRSIPQAIAGTARSSGGPLAFFQGLSAQAARDMPVRALQIAAYAKARSVYLNRYKGDTNSSSPLSGRDSIIVGAAVGAAVGAVTTPLDVIKTRIMSQRPGAGKSYGNWLECAHHSIKLEGPCALFRGALPRIVYMAASVAIFSLGYEASKTYIADRKLLWHADVASSTSSASSRRRRQASSAVPVSTNPPF
jgi:solute carrier family 25 (mitochondrial S-adenosylmethionine transporter), member 26